MAMYRAPWNYAAAARARKRALFSAPPPAFLSGPIALNLLTTGYDIQATMSKACTISILIADTQPSDAAFDASSETIAASAGVPTTVHHTG